MLNIDIFNSVLTRKTKIFVQLSADSLLIVLSFIGAMLVRLESTAFISYREIWIVLLGIIPIILYSFHFFGLYRVLVRFLTGKILASVGKGAVVGATSLYLAGFLLESRFPRSVPLIFGVFIFLSIGGIRFIIRALLRKPVQILKRPVIIYGAGDSGLQLLNALFHGREYTPIALVDDDPNLLNLSVGGFRIYSPKQIPQIVQETGSRIVLLAVPSISRERRRKIVSSLEDLPIEIKTIPELSEIISGKAKITELRSVNPEDLLGRDPVPPDPRLMSQNIKGRVVLVSGAGGSIGSELCRQILSEQPVTLILFEISEYALYTIGEELSLIADRLKYQTNIIPVLGSVQYDRRLEDVIEKFGVDTIYHAAAYKHVPLVEDNVVEGILNNVFGTFAIASAAKKFGVENFILISTDKAVRPTNVMGATKRIAELICQAHAQEVSSTVFSMVRFGNVLGSSGSVIPRFRAQIERGGPVTVTHREITRYFMTIAEAAQLVIQAGAMAKGGDVFVLDMGEPVKIIDVAVGMVKRYGFQPHIVDSSDCPRVDESSIAICLTGLRKGEKLYEELLIGNNPAPTQHPLIMTASEVSLSMDALMLFLKQLHQACENGDLASIISIFCKLPLGYSPEVESNKITTFNPGATSKVT